MNLARMLTAATVAMLPAPALGAVTRSFCGTCGSSVAYADGCIGETIYFMLGAMDAPQANKPTLHAWVREQLPYLHMPDGLPRHLKSGVPRPEEGSPV